MAKKATAKGDRSDPKTNRSLAIREVIKSMPDAKAAEIAAAVNKQYGHHVTSTMVYMVKTKLNMAAGRKGRRGRRAAAAARSGGAATASATGTKANSAAPSSAATWVEAIRYARQLLKASGSVANATALLKAVDG